MSIENIVDYVIKTPKNTNPNVIRSLMKSEVDENTLQKAKEYTDSQQLGYITDNVIAHVTEFTDDESNVFYGSELVEGEQYQVLVNGSEMFYTVCKRDRFFWKRGLDSLSQGG